MIKIRPFNFSTEDYETLVFIDNAVYREHPFNIETWLYRDKIRKPDRIFQRHIIEFDDKAVAFGEYRQSTSPRKFHLFIVVHPDNEHLNIRPIYFEKAMTALSEFNPETIISGALDNLKPDVEFLEANGFKRAISEISSRLDVESFEDQKFAHILEKMKTENIEIISLKELQNRNSDWTGSLNGLYRTIADDVPRLVEPEKRTDDEFANYLYKDPTFNPECWFVALDQEMIVGLCECMTNQVDTERLDNRLTGVLRSYRRRGIATALKLHTIEFARKSGRKKIVTFNEENNPMYLINRMLGFKPQPGWVAYEKVLK